MQGHAAQLRDEYLEEMATLMTTQINTDIATTIKNIQHCEEGARGGAVSTILVPDEMRSPCLYDNVLSSLRFAPGWTFIVDEDEAWDTSFAHSPLKGYIGDYGIGSGAQGILDGNSNPNVASSLPA
eukprot:5206175-Ditylum_brightwellii.AAC.1